MPGTSRPKSRIWEVTGMAHIDSWWLDQTSKELAAGELDAPQVSADQQQITESPIRRASARRSWRTPTMTLQF